MLPGGIAVPDVEATPVVGRAAVVSESRWFYVRMAYACAAVAVLGFVPTYWMPLATGGFEGASLLHFHGWLFTAWMAVFVLQARAAATHRFDRHRALGLAGIAVATAMLFTGLMVAVHAIERSATAGFGVEARTFAIVPISIILFFAGAVAAAVASVRRPDAHMRLMLVATISILPPAIARVVFLLLAPAGAARPGEGAPPTVLMALIPSFTANLLLVVAMAYDWRTRGRVHPVYIAAGIALLAMQLGRIPLSTSSAWHAVAGWLVAFAG
jgi:hypothetical protein